MSLLIIGSGPLPCEHYLPVMAPGLRTWQIAQAAVQGLAHQRDIEPEPILILGLEQEARAETRKLVPLSIPMASPEAAGRTAWPVAYIPLTLDDMRALEAAPDAAGLPLPAGIRAVIGTASIQPCHTATVLAAHFGVPCWADLFGDPLAELQTRGEPGAAPDPEDETLRLHVWKLLLGVLLGADEFSALSARQRCTVIGQAGVAGRLNRAMTGRNFIHEIPYTLFPADFPEVRPLPGESPLRLLWFGGFNSWADIPTLIAGLRLAFERDHRCELHVLGGKIPHYAESPYHAFAEAAAELPLKDRVIFHDWKPYASLPDAVAGCHAVLSIDRPTNEAWLGSRTRIVHALAHGRAVLSTALSEVTAAAAEAGVLIPFVPRDAESLAGAIGAVLARAQELAALGLRGRTFLQSAYPWEKVHAPLVAWVREPRPDPSRASSPLAEFWHAARAESPVWNA